MIYRTGFSFLFPFMEVYDFIVQIQRDALGLEKGANTMRRRDAVPYLLSFFSQPLAHTGFSISGSQKGSLLHNYKIMNGPKPQNITPIKYIE